MISDSGADSTGDAGDSEAEDGSATALDAAAQSSRDAGAEGADSQVLDGATAAPDAEAASDSATAMDAGDPGADATIQDASSTPDAAMPDAGGETVPDAGGETVPDAGAEAWPPPGCTVYRLGPSEPIWVAGNTETFPVVSVAAPWGDAPAQALAFRSLPGSSAARHMYLMGTFHQMLAFSGPNETRSAPLPPDVGMFLPSAPDGLLLSIHYDNLGAEGREDRSAFEVCVVTGLTRRPNTAGLTMMSPLAFPMVPAHVENHEVTGRCELEVERPLQLAMLLPFAGPRAVASRVTLQRAGEPAATALHEASYAVASVGGIGLVPPVTVSNGDTIASTCVYSNPSDRVFNFGERSGDEMCLNFILAYPRGVLRCKPEQSPF